MEPVNDECTVDDCENVAHWIIGTDHPFEVFHACAVHGFLYENQGYPMRAICDNPRCKKEPDDRPTRVMHSGGGVHQFCSEKCAEHFTTGTAYLMTSN